MTHGERPGAFLWFVHSFGLLSVTEALVIALFALTLKELPGGTDVQIGYAFWVFMLSAVWSLALTRHLAIQADANA